MSDPSADSHPTGPSAALSRSGRSLRHRLVVDPVVQGLLIGRTLLYGTALSIYLLTMAFFMQPRGSEEISLAERLGQFALEALPWLSALLVVVPLVLWDMVRLSNRFAGPAYRLKQHLLQLGLGEPTAKMGVREDDFWCELADAFNSVRADVQRLRGEEVRPLITVPAPPAAPQGDEPS